MKKNEIEIILLAAGLGTRMKSELPKVLHQAGDLPMLLNLIREMAQLNNEFDLTFNVVVGYRKELVIDAVNQFVKNQGWSFKFKFTEQTAQLGTGHAVKLALANQVSAQTVAVINGDLPLWTAASFKDFFQQHKKAGSVASLASALLSDGAQYGRVVRQAKKFIEVVEHKDASSAQRKICEINGGVYLFDRALAQAVLAKAQNKNAAQEYYLTDIFKVARKQRKKIYAHTVADSNVLLGVNNLFELAEAAKLFYLNINKKHLLNGVFIQDPATTFISPEVIIEAGAVIAPFTQISGKSVIAKGAKISMLCDLNQVQVGANSVIKQSTVAEKSVIGKNCTVGPMAQLRPGTRLADQVRVGNFVEIKESNIGSHTNAAHLSYIGDADIGEHVNLGCGFITCNYDGLVRDGKRKHRSVIGNNVFIGSDSQVVAPIKIADGSFIASGSTVTDSVLENDSLVIARTRQVTKLGYAKKYKKS